MAHWALSESPSYRARPSPPPNDTTASDPEIVGRHRTLSVFSDSEQGDTRSSLDSSRPDAIEEVFEPVSPKLNRDYGTDTSPPAAGLTNLIRDNEPQKRGRHYLSVGASGAYPDTDSQSEISVVVDDFDAGEVTETSALLPRERLPVHRKSAKYPEQGLAEQPTTGVAKIWKWYKFSAQEAIRKVTHPQKWDIPHMWEVGVGAIAAVFLGLLLNILDALSYGTY